MNWEIYEKLEVDKHFLGLLLMINRDELYISLAKRCLFWKDQILKDLQLNYLIIILNLYS